MDRGSTFYILFTITKITLAFFQNKIKWKATWNNYITSGKYCMVKVAVIFINDVTE